MNSRGGGAIAPIATPMDPPLHENYPLIKLDHHAKSGQCFSYRARVWA